MMLSKSLQLAFYEAKFLRILFLRCTFSGKLFKLILLKNSAFALKKKSKKILGKNPTKKNRSSLLKKIFFIEFFFTRNFRVLEKLNRQ